MSRSRRKTPICGVTCADSEKWDKRNAHRRLRRRVRQAIHHGREVMPIRNEVCTTWNMPKDGKLLFDPVEFPRLMRK